MLNSVYDMNVDDDLLRECYCAYAQCSCVQIKEKACMEERDGHSTTDCYTTTLSCLFPFVLFAVSWPLFNTYVKTFTCMWRVCLCELTIKTCATTSSVLQVSLLASCLSLHLGRLQTLWKMLQPGHVTFWHQNLSPFCRLIAMKGHSGLESNLQNVCIACKTQESK